MNNEQLLSALLRAAQSGQMEIRRMLDRAMNPNLRLILQSQLIEYDAIETEALTMGTQRGWDLKVMEAGHRLLTEKFLRIRRSGADTDSQIAEIMIRKNTSSMIAGLKNLHQYKGQDSLVCILAQKMLDCETAHIRRLQSYL